MLLPASQVLPKPLLRTTVYTCHLMRVTTRSPTKEYPLRCSWKARGHIAVSSHLKLQFQTVPKQRPRQSSLAGGQGHVESPNARCWETKPQAGLTSNIRTTQDFLHLPLPTQEAHLIQTHQKHLYGCHLKGVVVRENVRSGRQPWSC